MKKFLTPAVLAALALLLTACGPGEDVLVSSDQEISVTAEVTTAAEESVSATQALTDAATTALGTDTEISETEAEPATTSKTEPNAVTEKTTAKTTEKTSEKTSEATTTNLPETDPPETSAETEPVSDEEPEDLGESDEWQVVENLDEYLASLGIDEGSGFDVDD